MNYSSLMMNDKQDSNRPFNNGSAITTPSSARVNKPIGNDASNNATVHNVNDGSLKLVSNEQIGTPRSEPIKEGNKQANGTVSTQIAHTNKFKNRLLAAAAATTTTTTTPKFDSSLNSRPIAHIDQVNASSPILYVKNRQQIASILASISRGQEMNQTNMKLVQQAATKDQSHSISNTQDDDQQTSDTITKATLSSSTSSPKTMIVQDDQNKWVAKSTTDQLIKARANSLIGLEMLELEIGSSSVRLAWTILRDKSSQFRSKRDNSKPRKSVELAPIEEVVKNMTSKPPKSFPSTTTNAPSTLAVHNDITSTRRLTSEPRNTIKGPTSIKSGLGSSSRIGKMVNMTHPSKLNVSLSGLTPTPPTWLVRLRPFGSIQSDVVKLIIKSQETNNKTNNSQAQDFRFAPSPIRYITFTNLEASSAYELCVETTTANGISHLMDPNNLLNMRMQSHEQSVENCANVNQTITCDHKKHLDVVAGQDQAAITIRCREFFTSNSSDAPTPIGKLGHLPAPHESGLGNAIAFATGPEELASEQESNMLAQKNSNDTASSVVDSSLHLRRAKSLASAKNNHLHSVVAVGNWSSSSNARNHIELLEIEDPAAEMDSESRDAQMSWTIPNTFHGNQFHQANSQKSPQPASKEGQQLNSLISPTVHMPSSRIDVAQSIDNVRYLRANETGSPGQSGNLLALGWSMPPLMGYVFIVIFVLALINLIVNSMTTSNNCIGTSQQASRGRKRRRQSPSLNMNGQQHLTLTIQDHELNQQAQSPYSTQFDCSSQASSRRALATRALASPRYSNSRLMLVGGGGSSSGLHQANWQPFSQSVAALHELPLNENKSAYKQLYSSSMLLSSSGKMAKHQDSQQSASVGAKSKATKQVLSLVSNARFPLGPSFEGDAKHNADMVGLARKNYDLLMSKTFNAQSMELADDANFEPLANLNLSLSERHSIKSFKSIGKQNDNDIAPQQANCGTRHRPDHHEHKRRVHQHRAYKQLQKQSHLSEQHQQPSSAQSNIRIRYDKINPLYNMTLPKSPSFDTTNQRDSSASTTSTSSTTTTTHVHTTKSLKSFSMPANKQEQANSSHEALISLGSHDEPSIDCHDENCPENRDSSGLFDCCLDRQQQRFQQQQLQIERRPRIDGTILPQPFIMPVSSSDPIGSASTDNIDDPLPPPTPPPLPQTETKNSNCGVDQPGEINLNAMETPEPPEPLSLGAFDEHQDPATPIVAGESVTNRRANHHSDRKIPSAAETKGVEICEISAAQSPPPEIINRTDFEQRRQELKSKLQFMNRQKM